MRFAAAEAGQPGHGMGRRRAAGTPDGVHRHAANCPQTVIRSMRFASVDKTAPARASYFNATVIEARASDDPSQFDVCIRSELDAPFCDDLTCGACITYHR